MHVYDAEVLRVRARTYTNLDAAPPGFHTARQLARRCSNCVPPSMISSHAASPARAALIDTVRLLPADNVLPERAQPARYWFHPGRRAGSHPGRRHGLRRIETVVPEGFNRPRERRVLCFRPRITAPMDHTADKRDVALRLRSQLKDCECAGV